MKFSRSLNIYLLKKTDIKFFKNLNLMKKEEPILRNLISILIA